MSDKTKTQSSQPGREHQMQPKPIFNDSTYKGSQKLQDKVAIVTGGDSGIGRAVAIFFAKEGANVVIPYLDEDKDAEETKKAVEAIGQGCIIISADLSKEKNCQDVVEKTIEEFGQLDILVNNIGQQYPQEEIEDISEEQLKHTFNTNLFSYFYMIKAAMPYLKSGSAIINTASVTMYKGSKNLIDYSATKGAIVALTRSLSASVVNKGIRVNGVAPGPIWTPLIDASFDEDKIKEFGKDTPMQRAGQPEEVAPSFVFLASDDSSYMTGQFLHPNGGVIVNG